MTLKPTPVAIILLYAIMLLYGLSHAQAQLITLPYEPDVAVGVDGTIEAGEYKGSYSEATTGINIYWEHDGTNMYVAIESPGTGWVGIGFGPKGTGMDGANIIIGYVEDASPYDLVLADNFGEGWEHLNDVSGGGSDDIVSKEGSQDGGKTTIEFVFPLDSGDSKDFGLSTGGTYGFFVAYHESQDDLESYHTAHSATLDLYVEGLGTPPEADFSYVMHGLAVHFKDESTIQEGSITDWFWNFGDGSNSTMQNPNHTFPAMDEYVVELKVTDSEGDTATKSEKIIIPSKEERFQIWRTQVAVVSVAIVFISSFAVGIAASARKEGVKK